MRTLTWLIVIIFVAPLHGSAYIGPGLGLGAVGAVFGVIFSVLLAVFAIFWYPLKRLISKFSRTKQAPPDDTESK